VALGGEQHVLKTAQHMGTDRFALIAAGHDRGVGVDAEMVRPEPHQPLDQANLGIDRRIEAGPGLVAEELARQRHGFRLRGNGRRIRLGLHCRLSAGVQHRDFRGGCAALLFALVVGCTLGVKLEDRPIGRSAARQIGICDQSRVRPFQLGKERAPRVGSDRRDRTGARPEAESVQCQSRFLRIEGHQRRPPRSRSTGRYRQPATLYHRCSRSLPAA
jgi:hypothetical protein